MASNKNNGSPLLYTIRNWYENKSKTGIMLTLTAKDSKSEYHTIKAYVPYNSYYENSPKAEKLLTINNQQAMARISVFNEKQFEQLEEEY